MKSKRILPATIGAAIFLASCAANPIPEFAGPQLAAGAEPKLNTSSSTTVGGVLYTQFQYWQDGKYVLRESRIMKVYEGTINVNEGDALIPSKMGDQKIYITEKQSNQLSVAGAVPAYFIDADGDGAFEKTTVHADFAWRESEISPPLHYGPELVASSSGRPSFKYELLYQGISKGTLKLAYREFINDLARPAFSQDVVYDLATFPTTLTFRNLKIEISKADNDGITYRVLSGL
ncbi:MAG: hypothetical protein EPO08_01760 [Rhodospirillaceae bacterium]|nr:MAG: hypothetical protein EPO08_01760 [Rhodospirillaceae bacterium]